MPRYKIESHPSSANPVDREVRQWEHAKSIAQASANETGQTIRVYDRLKDCDEFFEPKGN